MADLDGVMIEESPEQKVEVAKPTLTQMAEAGLSAPEIELAEKLKIVEPAKEPEKVPEKKTEEELGKRPDVQEAFNDPEKEVDLLKSFNKNETGLYLKMRKENHQRKAAESERDHALIKLKAEQEKAARLESELKSAREKPAAKAETEEEEDIFGNKKPKEGEVNEDDKPLTKRDLENLKKEQDDTKKKEADKAADKQARGQKLMHVLDAQEAEAKGRLDNFEQAATLATEILKSVQNLDGIIADKRQQSRARKLVTDFYHAVSNADKFADGDYNAADVAYELGKMHPKFGETDAGGKTGDKDGDLNPEKAKKVMQNASKRGSSAALGGGGKKFVPYEEMSAEQLAGLSAEEFRKVPREIRQRILADV